jgi:hypothetical protein
MQATIDAGLKCYLVMTAHAPPAYDNAIGTYAEDVLDTVSYIADYCSANSIVDPSNESHTILNNSNVYIVLTGYGRANSEVGFLTGDDSTGYGNSVLAAEANVGTFQLYGTY